MPFSEEDIIQKYFAPLTGGDRAACGLKDDTAAIEIAIEIAIGGACSFATGGVHSADGADCRVLTSDMLVAGVHFFENDAPEDIAWKALAVNVSDLLSSGGAPDYYLLNICLNAEIDEPWIAAFASGLKAAQEKFQIRLIGGDTTYADGPLVISITAMGTAPRSGYRPRTGAGAGDQIFVTGTIGDSYLGCALRKDESLSEQWGLDQVDQDYLVDRYLRPRPRLEMLEILRQYASAAMDISDGLVLDLDRLTSASGVGGVMIADNVPLSAVARKIIEIEPERLMGVLTGGDDYELLLTVPAENSDKFIQLTSELTSQQSNHLNVPVSCIGSCTSNAGKAGTEGTEGKVEWRTIEGTILCFEKPGFDHFDH